MHCILPSSAARSSRRAAFTLIELLTVIAIIGILAAILIPTVSKVRESARQSQGLSNIRQVTMALLTYAQDNQGRLISWNERRPNGSEGLWSEILTQYLASGNLNIQPARTADIFRDPVAAANTVGTPPHQFGFLAGFTTQNDSAALQRFRRLDSHKSPAQQIFVADAGLNADGLAHGDLWAVDGGWWAWSAVWGGTPSGPQANDPINPGNSEQGNIRWTAGRAKFGFMDGHVAVLAQNQVTKRMINPLYQ